MAGKLAVTQSRGAQVGSIPSFSTIPDTQGGKACSERVEEGSIPSSGTNYAGMVKWQSSLASTQQLRVRVPLSAPMQRCASGYADSLSKC